MRLWDADVYKPLKNIPIIANEIMTNPPSNMPSKVLKWSRILLGVSEDMDSSGFNFLADDDPELVRVDDGVGLGVAYN